MANNLAAKGSFRKNDKKSNPKSPEWIGSLTTQEQIPAATKLYLGIWKNQGDRGETYFSVNATFPEQQQQRAPLAQTRGNYRNPPASDDLDDDAIPF